MITATRNWIRRNRTQLAVGAGLLGAGYLAGQYVLNKIADARQRMSDDRVAKEKYAGQDSRNLFVAYDLVTACGEGSPKTKKTAPTPFLLFYLRQPRISIVLYP